MWKLKRAFSEGIKAVCDVLLRILIGVGMTFPIAIGGITENWKWLWLLIVTFPFFGAAGCWFIEHS